MLSVLQHPDFYPSIVRLKSYSFLNYVSCTSVLSLSDHTVLVQVIVGVNNFIVGAQATKPIGLKPTPKIKSAGASFK